MSLASSDTPGVAAGRPLQRPRPNVPEPGLPGPDPGARGPAQPGRGGEGVRL